MTKSQASILSKFVFIGSVASSTFLFLIYLNSVYLKSDFVLIGVVQEMFTLPAMFLQPFLLILAGINFIKSNFQLLSYSTFTIVISLTTILLLIRSFI